MSKRREVWIDADSGDKYSSKVSAMHYGCLEADLERYIPASSVARLVEAAKRAASETMRVVPGCECSMCAIRSALAAIADDKGEA